MTRARVPNAQHEIWLQGIKDQVNADKTKGDDTYYQALKSLHENDWSKRETYYVGYWESPAMQSRSPQRETNDR